MFVLEVTDKAFLVLDNGSLLIDYLFLFANLFLELLFTLVGLGNSFFCCGSQSHRAQASLA
jgi:hypothetical protein